MYDILRKLAVQVENLLLNGTKIGLAEGEESPLFREERDSVSIAVAATTPLPANSHAAESLVAQLMRSYFPTDLR